MSIVRLYASVIVTQESELLQGGTMNETIWKTMKETRSIALKTKVDRRAMLDDASAQNVTAYILDIPGLGE